MTSTTPAESWPQYYVGQHESKRQLPISPETLHQALEVGYRMLTTPITTPDFHSRVLTTLSNHLWDLKTSSNGASSIPTIPTLSPTDTPLAPGETLSQLFGVVSPWIDLASPDPVVFEISRQVLELEVSYAAFCGLGSVIIPGPKLQYGNAHGEGVAQYAFAVQEALSLSNYTQLLIHLPMVYHPDQDSEDVEGSLSQHVRSEYVEEGGKSEHDFLGTWDAWNVIRTVCKYNARLLVALAIPRHLPPMHVQSRWLSEPLKLLSLTTQTFSPYLGQYPSLTQSHQALIHRYMRLRIPPWILLCDVGPIPGSQTQDPVSLLSNGTHTTDPSVLPTPAEAAHLPSQNKAPNSGKGPTDYLTYILNDLQRKQSPLTILESFGAGYQDYLQGPLQPLADNLESMTYEVFEKDPIKYDAYESAIRKALTDWDLNQKPASAPDGRSVVVAVVGAGRGPLVTRALKAAGEAGVQIEIWAVEKNPNAFVLLQRHNEMEWHNRVHLIQSDMREWQGPFSSSQSASTNQHQTPNQTHQAEKKKHHHTIDILISELLGSFADNELSPECLSHPCSLLSSPHGISIPSSYTNYLSPISAPKLHSDIQLRTLNGDTTAVGTPYVVMLHAIDFLAKKDVERGFWRETTKEERGKGMGERRKVWRVDEEAVIESAWSFEHGALKKEVEGVKGDNRHNNRTASLHFNIPHRGVCHGLAGYFEAVLYDNIELSTHPLRMKEKGCADMMSWFPIYFPLKTPLYTPSSSTMTVTIRRVTDSRKVWYEWMVETFLLQPAADRSSTIPSTSNSDFRGGEKREEKREGVRDSKGTGMGKAVREKKIRLGVSEVGTSKENGCMM
ncbi:MAG: hypothetical protein Q9174_001382 [Haloplaca sp. 1 TL-2023]